MTNDDEKKYINDVINTDIDLAKAVNKLSQSTLEKLRISLIDLVGDDLKNADDDGAIPVYFLDKVPGKKQAQVIKRLFDNFDVDDDIMGSEAVQQVIDAAVNSYKTSNSAAITAVVFLAMANHMQNTNILMENSAKKDSDMAINHLTGDNGQFNGNRSIVSLYPSFISSTDSNGNLVPDINYASTFNAATGIANAVRGELYKGATSSEFTTFLTAGAIQLAIISKNDKTTRDYKVKNGNNIAGWLSRVDSDSLRTYRTITAMCHSQFKKNIADMYKIKEATIINEMDPCKFCINNINRTFSVDDAVSRVPSHYNCRCEVRLINKSGEIIDDDSELD